MRCTALNSCLLGVSALLLPAPASAANDVAAFSTSIDEFRQLSQVDQKSLVASAFEHRLQHSRNIQYEALLLSSISEYRDNRVGKVIEQLYGRRWRHWKLGRSFRLDMDRGGLFVSKANEFFVCGLDSDAGVVKSTHYLSSDEIVFGRIDVNVDRVAEYNRYAYWLDGEHTGTAENIFRYLLDHRNELTIETPRDSDAVRLTVPWQPIYFQEPLGTKSFALDPGKGFLPKYGIGRWEKDNLTHPLWRWEEFFVEDAQLVGDVWMPTKLREVIGSSLFDDEHKVNVHETTVSRIESGIVTPKDLEVQFRPETRVVDAIRGEAFVVGQNGERTRVQPLIGAGTFPPPQVDDPAPSHLNWMNVVLLNLVGLSLLALFLYLRSFMHRRSEVTT